jgi:transcriptional regulator with XRE-family HTH domain
VDVCLVIKQRLEELGLEQRNLAAAVGVTESYISQLLSGKKSPPAPGRTEIYGKMGRYLRFPGGELAKLADHQRREELKRSLGGSPAPLFREVREMILVKCRRDNAKQIRAIFEKEPFGELEQLVTQKLLDVVKRVVHAELESETWLRSVARLSGRSYYEMRISLVEFMDANAFKVSVQNWAAFLDPLIESWDINLATFGMEIVLNRRLIPGYAKKIDFVERELVKQEEEPGLKEFLRHQGVSGDATEEEIEFLKNLKFKERQPTALYYYRELQNLRDPLHFRAVAAQVLQDKKLGQSQPGASVAPMHTYLEASGIEKQLELEGRKRAIGRWTGKRGSTAKKQKTKPRNDSSAGSKRLI